MTETRLGQGGPRGGRPPRASPGNDGGARPGPAVADKTGVRGTSTILTAAVLLFAAFQAPCDVRSAGAHDLSIAATGSHHGCPEIQPTTPPPSWHPIAAAAYAPAAAVLPRGGTILSRPRRAAARQGAPLAPPLRL